MLLWPICCWSHLAEHFRAMCSDAKVCLALWAEKVPSRPASRSTRLKSRPTARWSYGVPALLRNSHAGTGRQPRALGPELIEHLTEAGADVDRARLAVLRGSHDHRPDAPRVERPADVQLPAAPTVDRVDPVVIQSQGEGLADPGAGQEQQG